MTTSARRRPFSRGSGPGAITPDGCPVEFYRLLNARSEPDLIHAAAGPGATILELGAGSGRITRPLVDLGHDVVAVDESPEMLAGIDCATTVCAAIEDLHLDRAFDTVVLASFLVEIPDDQIRHEFLSCCRRHVTDTGVVVLERHAPDWHDSVAPYERLTPAGHLVRMTSVERPSAGVVRATVEYTVDDQTWSHAFDTVHLTDATLDTDLEAAGLRVRSYLTADHRWVAAEPVT